MSVVVKKAKGGSTQTITTTTSCLKYTGYIVLDDFPRWEDCDGTYEYCNSVTDLQQAKKFPYAVFKYKLESDSTKPMKAYFKKGKLVTTLGVTHSFCFHSLQFPSFVSTTDRVYLQAEWRKIWSRSPQYVVYRGPYTDQGYMPFILKFENNRNTHFLMATDSCHRPVDFDASRAEPIMKNWFSPIS